MADQPRSRPANRPSRRHELVSAARELFALQPWELVTVSDVVDRAGMTPAAFYYHFSSRDELLEELVHEYSNRWAELGEQLWGEANTAEEFSAVAPAILDWVAAEEEASMVFFLSAAGASFAIENLRQDARNRLIRAADAALRRTEAGLTRSESGVRATAAVVVCEVMARSMLSRDDSFRTLGPRRFREETISLVDTLTLASAESIP